MTTRPKNARMIIKFGPRHDWLPEPYPLYVDKDGFILQQDIWRGTPYKFLGFDEGKVAISTVSGDEYVIDRVVSKVIYSEN